MRHVACRDRSTTRHVACSTRETAMGSFTKAGLHQVRDVLERHVESGRIPGLVALFSRGDQTHVEAIGTMRHDGGPPMRRDTIFRMASTSKPVSIAAAMVLLDECRLPPLYAPDPQTGEFHVWDRAAGGRWSTPPAFEGGGG